jgi:tetratricopeptide (TPR) repeat protein
MVRAVRHTGDLLLTMRRVWLSSLVVFLATFAVFSRVLVADFVQWDDDISVYQNPHIQGLDWARLHWMFSDASYAMRYKPLTWLAYALIYRAGGLAPAGYHFANLLLHCFNAVLVLLVVRRLLAAGTQGRPIDEALAQATFPAGIAALLWAINPLRVEPVARVTDLTFCLQLLFLLISLWCYLRAWRGGVGEHRFGPWYWCSVAAFGLAMLAYPFALGYGVVLLLLDWYPLARFEGCSHWWQDSSARRVLLEKVPFLFLGGMMLPTIAARLNPAGVWMPFRVDVHMNLFERAMQAFYVWAYYAWKPWAPFHLSPFYTTLMGFNPNTWPFWLSAAFVIGTTILLVRRRRQWPWVLVLWASHLVLLVPVLGLTERPHFTVDRYDYLPGLVWAVAIAGALRWVNTRLGLRAMGTAIAITLAVFWGGLSLRQTRVWRNSTTLFTHMIHELGDDPRRSDIQWRLGAVLADQGRMQQAAQEYAASLRTHPTPEAYFAFAELLQRNGDRHGALTNCLAALGLDLTPLNRVQAGQVLASLGRSADAIIQYRVALAMAPDLVPALNNLAWILATDRGVTNRNGAEAVQLAQRACVLTGYQTPVLIGTLAAGYAEAGRFKEAVDTARRARDLALAARQPDVAEKNRQLLGLYQSGRAYHQPPVGNGASRVAQ